MGVLRVLKDGELALTHVFSPSKSIPRTFHHPHLLGYRTTQQRTVPHTLFRMASTLQRRPEWTADQVRETFLDYFKKNGHTFGKSQFRPSFALFFVTDWEKLYSAFVFGGSPLRSHPAFHQCWNEPVQVDFPGNCRSSVRFCTAQARCQLPEGMPRPRAFPYARLADMIIVHSCGRQT